MLSFCFCETYIVEEISIFILYYFEPYLRAQINLILGHDDDKEVLLSVDLSIFSHSKRLLYIKKTMRERYLTKTKFRHAHNFMLFNYDKLRLFIQ